MPQPAPRHFATVLAAALGLMGAPLGAQELLHYRFDGDCGDAVHNLGTLPADGQIVSDLPGAPAATRIPGAFGQGLAPGQVALRNEVITGWNPGTYNGPFTVAFHASLVGTPAQTPGVPVPFGYVCGTNGLSLRCSIGAAGSFRLDWGQFGSPDSIVMTQDATNRMRSGWVHVAFVISTMDNTASVYVDGTLDSVQSLAVPPGFFGAAFVVGNVTAVGPTPSPVGLDEFLLADRAMSAAEIANLAAAPRAMAKAYGTGCGAELRVASGRPVVGGSMVVEVLDSQGAGWLLFGGLSRCAVSAGPTLPLDLTAVDPRLAGCLGHVSLDLGIQNSAGGFQGGLGTIPVQIPTAVGLLGLMTHWQVVVGRMDGSLGTSNALTVSLGL